MGESNLTEKIGRIADNIAESYSVAEELGATMPETQNSDNLANTLRTVTPASAVDLSGYVPKSGATMEGVLQAQNNTQYTVQQVRNAIYLPAGSDMPTLGLGDQCWFYEVVE